MLQTNIILTGISGLGKLDIAKNIRKFLLRQDSDWLSAQAAGNVSLMESRAKELVSVISLDTPPGIYLSSNEYDLKNGWIRNFQGVLSAIELSDKVPNRIFLLHATYLIQSNYWSPLSIQIAGKTFVDTISSILKPSIVVNLIENVYSMYPRIGDHRYFSMKELLSWRQIESLISDSIASNIFVGSQDINFPYNRSPMFAVRHPLTSLMRYIYNPSVPKIYLSFPIGEPRRFKKAHGREHPFVEELNHFRRYFREKFTVFDPLTIDEKPLTFVEKLEEGDVLPLWQFEWPDDDFLRITNDTVPREIVVPWNYVEEVCKVMQPKEKSDILRQIGLRDHRLIDQSDCLIAYRPNASCKEEESTRERWSNGTQAEWLYAGQRGRKRYVISQKGDGSVNEHDVAAPIHQTDMHIADSLRSPEERELAFTAVAEKILAYVKKGRDNE